jgi:sulfatase maturation enzyme AslB (radical SAM superfamily)
MIIPELVDGCNLKCKLCWNRNRKGSFKQMSLKTVEKVIQTFGLRANYHWYNWGEPLLYNQFHDFVELAKNAKSTISSNFSMHLTDSHFADLSKLRQVIASISGATKPVYELYHVGANYKIVLQNLAKLKDIASTTKVTLNWIDHTDNYHQQQWAKDWCKLQNFNFTKVNLNCEVEELISGFKHPYLQYPLPMNNKGKICKIVNWTPISVEGEYLLCCASHNVKTGYTIWDNVSPEELVQIKLEQPLCQSCCAGQHWRAF